MSHEVESMAYAFDATSKKEEYSHPWHKEWTLDKSVPVHNDMSAKEMLVAAGLDWTVERTQAFIEVNGEQIPTGQDVLYRSKDNRILTPCSDKWHAAQPEVFADFFQEFCDEGSMEMNTMGSLMNGKRLFALAKVKGSEFSLFRGKDVVESYFLFSNPYVYGESLDFRFTPTRVVCWNTLSWALEGKSASGLGVRVSHRKKFDPSVVKEALNIAETKMQTYKEAAEFLSKKKVTVESLKEYYATVFPKRGQDLTKEIVLGKPAQLAYDQLESQPGAELGEGTWWAAYNAATYAVDHKFSRTGEKRMESAWFGNGKIMKDRALTTAIKFAEKV